VELSLQVWCRTGFGGGGGAVCGVGGGGGAVCGFGDGLDIFDNFLSKAAILDSRAFFELTLFFVAFLAGFLAAFLAGFLAAFLAGFLVLFLALAI